MRSHGRSVRARSERSTPRALLSRTDDHLRRDTVESRRVRDPHEQRPTRLRLRLADRRRLRDSTLAGELLVLKGGNALRKGYFPLTRFSDDLDFTTTGALSPGAPAGAIQHDLLLRRGAQRRHFLIDQNRIVDEQLIDESKRIYKLRLYFRDFTGNADHLTLKVKVDVTEYDRFHLPVQTRRLIHPYSDAEECNVEIRVIKLKEALADKISCLIQRRYTYDLFDLVYGVFVNNELAINRVESSTPSCARASLRAAR